MLYIKRLVMSHPESFPVLSITALRKLSCLHYRIAEMSDIALEHVLYCLIHMP